ncbi:nodulation protein NodH [Roseinatronobacter sp.]|uniref:nodulation protein NodH n=1 Tax=Roseinatronobacter sp. TaxID=1945755 RepID=UPI0025F02F38|nr:nodulation protein NodH [Rhodobaca sp.]
MSRGTRFRYFVILAEMRTGSNLLESCLNQFEGLACHGEAFNPHFVGYPKTETLFGFDKTARDDNPQGFLSCFAQQPGLMGFRYFHDHEPRVLDRFMRERSCAKIILTRNPLDSYVSLKIAQSTQQWRLGDVSQRKAAKVVFDPSEFEAHVRRLQDFQCRIQRMLQINGQTAFFIAYEDIKSLDVLNGLAHWLGLDETIDEFPRKLKRQNPETLDEKLVNPEAVGDGIARLDRFNLARSPNFEPPHPPILWAYRACSSQPLVYAPIPGCSERRILQWMGSIDGEGPEALLSNFTRETWRDWQRANPRRLAFTVLRHPLQRAHEVFVDQVLLGKRVNVRAFIERLHGLELPQDKSDLALFDTDKHRTAFLGFLQFVQANLNGQTAVQTRPIWASQSRIIEGISAQCPLHRLVREENLSDELSEICDRLGCKSPGFEPKPQRGPLHLEAIYDQTVEQAGRSAYGLDYELLGFQDYGAR